MENMFCLIDSNKGICIPMVFAYRWGNVCTKGITEADIDTLLSGPYHPEYWEIWEEVVNEVEFLFDGQKCTLFEDGDLFAVPVN